VSFLAVVCDSITGGIFGALGLGDLARKRVTLELNKIFYPYVYNLMVGTYMNCKAALLRAPIGTAELIARENFKLLTKKQQRTCINVMESVPGIGSLLLTILLLMSLFNLLSPIILPYISPIINFAKRIASYKNAQTTISRLELLQNQASKSNLHGSITAKDGRIDYELIADVHRREQPLIGYNDQPSTRYNQLAIEYEKPPSSQLAIEYKKPPSSQLAIKHKRPPLTEEKETFLNNARNLTERIVEGKESPDTLYNMYNAADANGKPKPSWWRRLKKWFSHETSDAAVETTEKPPSFGMFLSYGLFKNKENGL
jgi:hypothetical protein